MPPNEHDNHRLLFQQLAAGSETALEQIRLLYAEMLLLLIKPIVQNEEASKEVLADMLEAIWNNKEQLAQHPNPEGWMVVTARNKAINKFRKEKRNATDPLDLFPMLESSERIEAAMEVKDLQQCVDRAFEKLSPREKLVFTLRINGLNRKEIAEQLQASEHTVKNQLLNAMKKIREHLSKMLQAVFA